MRKPESWRALVLLVLYEMMIWWLWFKPHSASIREMMTLLHSHVVRKKVFSSFNLLLFPSFFLPSHLLPPCCPHHLHAPPCPAFLCPHPVSSTKHNWTSCSSTMTFLLSISLILPFYNFRTIFNCLLETFSGFNLFNPVAPLGGCVIVVCPSFVQTSRILTLF